MADKVKLTPPMTDSKAPEWVRDQAEDVHIMLVATKEANIDTISQALLYAYERGRKEGIEEAAKVATDHADAWGQLLEVKKDIDTRQNTK